MIMNSKMTGRTMSVPAGLAFGAAVSIGLTVIAAVILAELVDTGKLLWENIGYGVMGVLLLASFTGAAASYSKIKRQRLVVCVMSGMVYFALLLSATALFFGGQYEAIGVTALLIFGGSVCAGLLGLNQGRGGKSGKPRIRHR